MIHTEPDADEDAEVAVGGNDGADEEDQAIPQDLVESVEKEAGHEEDDVAMEADTEEDEQKAHTSTDEEGPVRRSGRNLRVRFISAIL